MVRTPFSGPRPKRVEAEFSLESQRENFSRQHESSEGQKGNKGHRRQDGARVEELPVEHP